MIEEFFFILHVANGIHILKFNYMYSNTYINIIFIIFVRILFYTNVIIRILVQISLDILILVQKFLFKTFSTIYNILTLIQTQMIGIILRILV